MASGGATLSAEGRQKDRCSTGDSIISGTGGALSRTFQAVAPTNFYASTPVALAPLSLSGQKPAHPSPEGIKKQKEQHEDVLSFLRETLKSVLGETVTKAKTGKTVPVDLIPMERGFARSVLGIQQSFRDVAAGKKDGFLDAISFVLDVEKGFYKDFKVNGGDTIFGISSRYHRKDYEEILNLWNQGDKKEAKNKTLTFYKEKFWDKIRDIDNLTPAAQKVAMNAAVMKDPSYANALIAKCEGDPICMIKEDARETADHARKSEHNKNHNFWGWMNRGAELANEILRPKVPPIILRPEGTALQSAPSGAAPPQLGYPM